jgi:hypothetical protein
VRDSVWNASRTENLFKPSARSNPTRERSEPPRRGSAAEKLGGGGCYQACESPQCGQPTDVETAASNTYPQRHA